MNDLVKQRVLMVGEHPQTFTGNGNMMGALLDQVDTDAYDVCCFLYGSLAADQVLDPFWQFPFPIIPANSQSDSDPWGKRKLLDVIQMYEFDTILFVGIDIWRYVECFDYLSQLLPEKDPRPVWKVLVPYDLHTVRDDWVRWLSFPDQVFVYSEYGYNLLKDILDNVFYFRPPLRYESVYKPTVSKAEARQAMFPGLSEDATLFTFVGANQIRKNIPRMLKGFSQAAKNNESDMRLYMHMPDPFNGLYNLKQLASDFEIPEGRILYKMGRTCYPEEMSTIYQASDCYVNLSMQEGLSWTVVEAMCCALPIIVSGATAHIELYNNNGIYMYPDETSFVPLMTDFGTAYVESRACSPARIEQAFSLFMQANQELRDEWTLNSLNHGNEWLAHTDLIDKMLAMPFERTTTQTRGDFI